MTEETIPGKTAPKGRWDGVDRRKTQEVPTVPESPVAVPPDLVPADWQARGLAFLIDLLISAGLVFGSPSAGYPILGGVLGMLYMVFRDGLFYGQSLGKKVMGIRVTHPDGRAISFVDSSFRNVFFIPYPIYYLIALFIVIEAFVATRTPERLRMGDRIAKTRVVQKSSVPVLA